MQRTIDLALIGLGNVGRNVLHILETRGDRLRDQYGLAFRVVCIADSSGVAVDAAGFDPAATRHAKAAGIKVRDMKGYLPGMTAVDVMAGLACDLVLEASPVNLQHGEPGLSVTRTALRRGISVVLANKGPLVLAYQELQAIAEAQGARMAFSATVCGALPVINIGMRDLVAARIHRLAGIFNATSNFILSEMAGGRTYADALAEAQRRGLAEADPSLDVEGWDTANKLVIIANSVLRTPATLQDVQVQGITQITTEELQAEQQRGKTIRLVAVANAEGEGYRLSVTPMALDNEEFLAGCDGWEMGIEIHSDLYGRMYHKIWENDPLPTAAAMIRDAVNLSI
jgi:homoserine dehydrogenase